MRRWFLRIFILTLLLLGAAVLTVQIILRTDIPRRTVLSALHENTGLRFNASALTTGWGGRTELSNLTLALPLERDPFVTIPSLRIAHTDLIRLAIFRSIDIDEAILERPHLVLKQDAAGAWNLARAAAIVESVQAQRAPAAEAARPINLPALSVRDARVDIHPDSVNRPNAQVITYAPIGIEGRPDAPLAWEFETFLDRERIAAGHLSPRGRWPHQVEIDIERAAPHLEPWRAELAGADASPEQLDIPDIPPDLSIAATWQGQLTSEGGGVTGRLTIDRFIAAGMSAHGAATITADGPVYIIEPHDLALDNVHPDVETVRLLSGRIVHEAAVDRTRLSRLLVESHAPDESAALFRGQIDAEWDAPAERGSANIHWSGRFEPWHADHEGAIALNFTVPSIGRRTLEATIVTQGALPQGAWDADLRISGYGRTWADIAGRIAAPRFDVITDENEYDFSGFAARFARSDRDVRLTHLDLPSAAPPADVPAATFRGRGAFNLDTLAWSADLAATNWIPPARVRPIELAPLDFRLRATGAPGGREVELTELAVQLREGDFVLSGRYSADEPHAPVSALLTIDMKIPDAGETLTGRARGEMNLTGIIEPLRLQLDGSIHATDLAWAANPMDDVHMQLRGTVDQHYAAFESDDFDLLGGSWRLSGDYSRAGNNATVALEARNTRIEQVVALVDGPPGIGGGLSMNVDVIVPQLDFPRADLAGSWTASDLRGVGGQFRADSGSGFIRAAGDRAHFTDLLLENNGGTMRGSAVMDLTTLRTLTIDVATEQWPLELPGLGVEARATGDAALDIDLAAASAIGDLTLTGSAALRDAPLGDFELQAAVLGRTLNLHNITADILGGQAQGAGVINLDPERWTESTADFTWNDVDLSLLAQHSDRFAPFDGISSGWISASRTDDPRAIEPIRIDMKATMREARYGAIDIETASLEAYLGRDRLMIRRANAAIADGDIEFWGRLTQHEGTPFAHLHVTLDQVDLQQIATFMEISPDDRPMPGRISGWGSAGGYLIEPRIEVITTVEGEQVEMMTGPRLFGQAQLSLTESDLGALPGFDALYSLLRVDFRRSQPTGHGEAIVRLENNALDISRLTYFNRGTDIVARLRLENIWRGAESPVTGLAAGVVRPLRDLDLPLVGRLDRLIGAIQADTASVRINGTLAEPATAVVPFGEVSGALSRILRGRVDQ